MKPLPCNVRGVLVLRLVSIIDLLMFIYVPVIPSPVWSFHHSSPVVISTKLGQVRGRVVQSSINETCRAEVDLPVTTQFLGVPYALPPVGRLRFQEPRKNSGWVLQGVLDATVPRERCPMEWKNTRMDTYEEGRQRDREDCLYMNIYVPGNLSSTGYIEAMNLPVLVMFNEEEEWKDLSGQDGDLSQLSSYGHIVVIDFSYRSGVLSYLGASREKFAIGNNGFRDQRLAMLWIWDNVREFGGNPEEITVFAERHASISLGYHVLQPDTRGLFARAVMHSGTPPSKDYLERDYSALASTVVDAVGCGDSLPENTECLQSVALDDLLRAAESAALNLTSWVGRMTDHEPIPLLVLESLDDGHFGQVDLLIGSSEHDGICLLREIDNPGIVKKSSMETLITNIMKGRYSNLSKSERTLRAVVAAVLFEYSSSCDIEQNETIARLLTDMMYRAPAEWTARLVSRRDNDVYLYEISSENYSCSSLRSLIRFTECSQRPVNGLANNVIEALVSFVRKGNPGPLNGLTNLRPFTELERHFLQFTDEGMHLKQSIRNRKMTFWNDYFPFLLDSNLDSCQSKDVVPNPTVDNGTNGGTVQMPLVICFLVAVGLILLIFLVFILTWFHRSRPLIISKHHSCFRSCCRTGQRQNRHDLMTSAVVPDNDDHILHPLPYSDDSAWN